MLHKLKTRGALALIALCNALLALAITVVGCNRDSGNSPKLVRKPSQQTVKPMPPPVIAQRSSDSVSVTPSPPAVVPVPEPPRIVTYEEAEGAFTERRYPAAVNLFTQYTERVNENPWGFYMLGLSAWKADDQPTAELSFERALELDPTHVKSWLNLSRVLLDERRSSEAMEKISRALELDPESNTAFRLQGRAFRQLGDKTNAVDSYQRAIELDNTDAWSMNNLGLIFIEDDFFERALPPLARAVEIEGEVAIFRNNLGMALEGVGQFRAAEESYRMATVIDPLYYKASTNMDRVAVVLEDPAIEPLDLEAIARLFEKEILSWSHAIAASAALDASGPDRVSQTTSPAVQLPGTTDEKSDKVDRGGSGDSTSVHHP